MITPLNILLIIVWAIVIPCMLGSLISGFNGTDNGRMIVAKHISYGFMLMCVLFLIPAVPMILMHVPFHILCITWETLVCILCILSLIFFFRKKKAAKPQNRERAENAGGIRGLLHMCTEDRSAVIVWLAALIVIAFEICLPVLRMHVDTDDARFLVDAMEALKKDTLLEYNPITGIHHGVPVGEQIKDVTAPFPIFIAW